MTEAAGSLQKADRKGTAVVARAAVNLEARAPLLSPPSALARCLLCLYIK